MKKNGQMVSLQILLTLWGWWGMLYPEFTLTEDTYRIVYEEMEDAGSEPGKAGGKAGAKEAEEDPEESPRDIYRTLLHARRGQIRFRSRLLMQLQDWMEQ